MSKSDAIVVAPSLDHDAWDQLMAQASVPHLPQSFAYGEGKLAKGWTVERVTFQRGTRTQAIATVLVRRAFGIQILARLNRGPVLLEDDISAADVTEIYATLRRHWRGPLLIAPALEHGADSAQILKNAGFRLRQDQGWRSGRIDLDPDEDQIWSSLGSTFRNRLRQAQKSAHALRVTDTDESYEWMLDRHVMNMREKGFSAADPTLLRALRASRPQDVLVFQMLHEGQAVAGMSVVRFGQCAEYHVGWFGPEGRRVNAGNFLMWEVIKEMKRRGARQFDVGGLRPGDGYTQFKRTMRPTEFRLAGEWMSF